MAEKVVSIKIGSSVTQVAEVDYGAKSQKIYRAFSFETPQGVLDDNGVHATEQFVGVLQHGLSGAGIKNDRVLFTVSSTRVASRDVTIPLVKEKKIKPLLVANAKDYFPVDLTEYQLVYRILEKNKAEKQQKLTVYAVPNLLVQSYQNLATALDMQLVTIDYVGNSVCQMMLRSMPTDLSATICVEDSTSIITVIRDGQVALQRVIGYGIDDAVNELTQGEFARNGMTYLGALDLMRSNQYIGDTLRSERDDGMNVRKGITSALTMLVGNISRVLDYYFSRNTDVELSRVALTGLGADCIGLDRLLSNELDVYVETVRKINTVDISREVAGSRFYMAEYYSNVGAAIQPLNLSFQSEAERQQNVSLKLPAIVCVGGVAISIALLMTQLLSNLVLSADNEEMILQMRGKSSVIDTYNQYTEALVINQELSMLKANSTEENDVYLDFLAELEERTPKDLTIQSLTLSDGLGNMSMSCNTKASAAEMLIQLRECRTIKSLSSTGITETEDESGKIGVTFTVTFQLDPDYKLALEAEEAAAAAEAEAEAAGEEGENAQESTQTTEIAD
jgi:type IV pilus assembly protein PilM